MNRPTGLLQSPYVLMSLFKRNHTNNANNDEMRILMLKIIMK